MQNIDKTDINSPGSTSQQESRQERALKAARNRRQVRLSAEAKEQRQAKLETERDSGIDNIFMLKEDKGTNQEIGLSQVQDRDRKLPQFSSTLANDFNGGTATSWITRIKTEYFFDDKDRSRRQTNGKSKRSAGCTFVANSRVRSLQHAVFQPIFLQTLRAIGKSKRLQERLTLERRLCYLAENTARRYQQ